MNATVNEINSYRQKEPYKLQYLAYKQVVWLGKTKPKLPPNMLEPNPYDKDYIPLMWKGHYNMEKPPFFKEWMSFYRHMFNTEDTIFRFCWMCFLAIFFDKIEEYPPEPQPDVRCGTRFVKRHFEKFKFVDGKAIELPPKRLCTLKDIRYN